MSVKKVLLLALLCTGCGTHKRMIVLGFDGCDPTLLQQYMAQGKLPNFQRLRQRGGMWKLGTTAPPQSPVAWATFDTGLDPSGHGIFDFVQRDPKTMTPVASMTSSEGGTSHLLRDGKPFWAVLSEHGVPATLQKVPADFPPGDDGGQVLTGMGTPDLLGTYGTFTFYTETPVALGIRGGQEVPVASINGTVRASLIGPVNSSLPLTATTSSNSILLDVDGQKQILKQGEWTEWERVHFEPAAGMVRFYLKSVHPFQLYASPINIDPNDPVVPISSPRRYASRLADDCGPFYTQGMAEDSKAVSAGVLDDPAYLQQSGFVFDDTERLFRQALREFKTGFLFTYLSSTDLQSHLYWNCIDPTHPGYRADRAKRYGHVIEDVYIRADAMLGEALAADDGHTTFFVLSDHGFAPFKRSFDLNAWLRREGYLFMQPDQPLQNADWSRSSAYAVGFNGLYLNLAGREAHGIVTDRSLLDTIAAKLLALRDHRRPVVLHCYPPKPGPHQSQAPDLVIGYARGYRASWETALGQTRKELFEDNLDHWSGDHLMDPSVVPGVLLCSRPITVADPTLLDLAPTFLAYFGIPALPAMHGRNLLN
jgi:predicted AlkP superfamily phosphohydrolase/phosphomutase